MSNAPSFIFEVFKAKFPTIDVMSWGPRGGNVIGIRTKDRVELRFTYISLNEWKLESKTGWRF